MPECPHEGECISAENIRQEQRKKAFQEVWDQWQHTHPPATEEMYEMFTAWLKEQLGS